MSDKYLIETKVSDSVLYKTLNENNKLQNNILRGLKSGKIITKEIIEEQLFQIKRTEISPLTNRVLNAFEEGSIKIIYVDPSITVTTSLPFFTTKLSNKVTTFIFANNYATLSKNKVTEVESLNISFKDLYALMEGAYISNCYAIKPELITSNLGLMRVTCELYTDLIIKVINKECAIANDPDVYNKVVFLIGYFYLDKVWGCTNKELKISYAKNNIVKRYSPEDILNVLTEYEESDIYDLKDLIGFIRGLSPRLQSLKIRLFIQYYIYTYKAPAVFGLECLQYFLFTIATSLLGSFIVNQTAISLTTKYNKNINTFYIELNKALKSSFF